MGDEFVKIVAGVVAAEMDLAADQIVLANEPFPIPPDQRLYCSVRLLGAGTFAANTEYVADPDQGYCEVQNVNRQEMYSFQLYSASGEARSRAWELPAAFKSTRMQQAMEAHSFKLGDLPQRLIDVSDAEGTQRLNRFSTTVNALVSYRKQKPVGYYDQFAQPKLYTNQ